MDKDSAGASGAGNAPDEAGARFAARRRVIKGCVGVPAVVTLVNGGPAAAASVFQCVANLEETNLPLDGNVPFRPDPNVPNDCPESDQRLVDPNTGFYDCGQDTAVRDPAVTPPNENLVRVDQDGNIGTGEGFVPTVQSCYASIANLSATTPGGSSDGTFSRLLDRLGLR